MWIITFIVAGTLVSSPPVEDKRLRISAILQQAQSTKAIDVAATVDRLSPKNPKWERVLTLKSLREHHRRKTVALLRKLTRDEDVDVRTEATIRLCQFKPTKANWELLSSLRDRGVNLRRAFQTGENRGRPIYRTEAAEFFVKNLSHANVYTRLDGAIGLVEIGQEPSLSVALRVFKELLDTGPVPVRRLVVHHMYTSFREPRFLALIKQAQQDEDSSVKRLADTLMDRQ